MIIGQKKTQNMYDTYIAFAFEKEEGMTAVKLQSTLLFGPTDKKELKEQTR